MKMLPTVVTWIRTDALPPTLGHDSNPSPGALDIPRNIHDRDYTSYSDYTYGPSGTP